MKRIYLTIVLFIVLVTAAAAQRFIATETFLFRLNGPDQEWELIANNKYAGIAVTVSSQYINIDARKEKVYRYYSDSEERITGYTDNGIYYEGYSFNGYDIMDNLPLTLSFLRYQGDPYITFNVFNNTYPMYNSRYYLFKKND